MLARHRSFVIHWEVLFAWSVFGAKPVVEVPENDEDLYNKTADEVASDLAHRDLIIKHGLLSELTDSASPVDDAVCKKALTVDEYIAASTPLSRLKSVFCSDVIEKETELGKAGSRALRLPLIISSCIGVAVGAVRLVSAGDEFVRSNYLTIWRTPEMAKRAAADYASLRALTLGLTTGFKVCFLTTGCYALPLVLSTMHGRSSFWEYAVGWGATCSIYCMYRGRRQMFAAGLIAFVPGLIYGCLNLIAVRYLGLTFEDLYRAHFWCGRRSHPSDIRTDVTFEWAASLSVFCAHKSSPLFARSWTPAIKDLCNAFVVLLPFPVPPSVIEKETELGKAGSRALRLPLIISSCIGVAVGAVRLVSAGDEFVRSNYLTIWRTPEMAKRAAADYASLRALTLGLTTGFKVCFLTTGCYALPLVLSTMHGRSSFWEYAVGWGATCSIYCMYRGRRQMFAAGLIAFVPGLIYGCLNLIAVRYLGLTFEDLYRAHVSTILQHKVT
ncbi:unnamed protein product [Dicrocoelium dendriticum]|nr:unnamed protein product [Dicrocoelium dendriticum]